MHAGLHNGHHTVVFVVVVAYYLYNKQINLLYIHTMQVLHIVKKTIP